MTRSKIPASKVNKKILVLKGAGKKGIQVEAPGGYIDSSVTRYHLVLGTWIDAICR